MKLLFLVSGNAASAELLGMAQLSAAFAQDVSMVWQQAPDNADLDACRDAGIQHLYYDMDPQQTQALIATAERVIRL